MGARGHGIVIAQKMSIVLGQVVENQRSVQRTVRRDRTTSFLFVLADFTDLHKEFGENAWRTQVRFGAAPKFRVKRETKHTTTPLISNENNNSSSCGASVAARHHRLHQNELLVGAVLCGRGSILRQHLHQHHIRIVHSRAVLK